MRRFRLLSLLVGLALMGSACTGEPSSPVSAGSPTTPASVATTAPSTPTSPATSTPTASSTPTQEPSEPALSLDYGVDGVFVEQPDQVDLLDGAPADFKTFVAGLAEKAQQVGASCPDAAHGITVQKLLGDFALGAINDCGGYAAIWARVDGAWAEVIGTQEAWQCAQLDEHDVPRELVRNCQR